MLVRVKAKVIEYEQLREDSDTYFVVFESLDPFIGAGANSAQIANKTSPRNSNRLLIHVPNDCIIRLGWALFDMKIQLFPYIRFICNCEVDVHPSLEDRVVILETMVASLIKDIAVLKSKENLSSSDD